jgi:hypothetical protein
MIKPKCLVLMPFKKEFEVIYQKVYKPACMKLGLECYHVGEISQPGSITRDIVKGILNAECIIADLTGANANVFYELGISHSYGNNSVMTALQGEKLPFDIRSYRVIFYRRTASGRLSLAKKLKRTIKEITTLSNKPNNPAQEVYADNPIPKITELLNRAVAEVVEKAKVRVRDFGFHVWAIRLVSEHSMPVLVRVARDQLRDVPSSPPRVWKKGEGVVGMCWDSEEKIVLNLSKKEYATVTPSKWHGKSRAFRMGQGYNDFRNTTKHFKAIFAVPIKKGDKFIGCLSSNIDKDSGVNIKLLWPNPLRDIMYRVSSDIVRNGYIG